MLIKSFSRPSTLINGRSSLSSTLSHLHTSEVLLTAGSSKQPRRSIDVSSILQAQGGNGVEGSISSELGRVSNVLEKCPDPLCHCAATPAMPEGLPIDMTSKMTMPYYDRHVVIGARSGSGMNPHASAQRWPSRIESDPSHPAALLKNQLGPRSGHYRPDLAISVTVSTLSSPNISESRLDGECEEFWLFPDFVRVRIPCHHEYSSKDTGSLDSAETGMAALAKAISTSAPLQQQIDTERTWKFECIAKPVILICGHGSRDQRCGILGPVLLSEFEKHVGTTEDALATAHVGLVSHIGGHKFAGNVIIYVPPAMVQVGSDKGLCGKAVWYGRVEPRHVEGIVKATIEGGRIIKELLRGVHSMSVAS